MEDLTRPPWWYRGMLRLMPRRFRAEHAAGIDDILAAGARDHSRSRASSWRFWSLALADLARGVIAARFMTPLSRSRLGAEGRPPLESILRDIVFGIRGVRRSPLSTGLCVLAIALGLGANTAVFTVINEILLAPLPVVDVGTLVDLHVEQPGSDSFAGFSKLELDRYAEADVLDGLTATSARTLRFGPPEAGETAGVSIVATNYFEVLGVRPFLGAGFGPGSPADVIVVSHGFWQRRLAGDPDIVGKQLLLNGAPFEVAGVGPERFSGRFIGFPMDLWVPLEAIDLLVSGARLDSPDFRQLEVFGRRVDDVSVEAVQQGLNAVATRLEEEFPEANRDRRVTVTPLTGIDDSLRAGVIAFLGVLLLLSGLVLIASCMNVGNLLLARGQARKAEIATRQALGATRVRVVRQLLIETVVVFVLGLAVAALVAWQILAALHRFIDSLPVPLSFNLSIDYRVVAMTLAATAITALFTGLAPAWRSTRTSHSEVLRAARTGGDATRLRGFMVALQVAVSVILLVSAGLFLRALQSADAFEPGFQVDGLVETSVGLSTRAASASEALLTLRTIAAEIADDPRVESVGLTVNAPLGVARSPVAISIPGYLPPAGQTSLFVDAHTVGPGYFETLGIDLDSGRRFEAVDELDGAPVAVVNRVMAQRFWPQGDVIGQRLEVDGIETRVVGIVEPVRYLMQDEPIGPLLYLPLLQHPGHRAAILMRTSAAPNTIRGLVAVVVAANAPDVLPPGVTTLRERLELFLFPQRVASRVAGGMGALGLILAISGVYGIVSFLMLQKQRELGIRLALGSSPAALQRTVLWAGGRLIGAGMAIGLVASVFVGRLLAAFLLGLPATDPLTYASVVTLIGGAALVATWIPARRALGIDPAATLRQA